MKSNFFFTVLIALLLSVNFSCNETPEVKLQDRIEDRAEELEDKSDELEVRSDELDDAADNLEDGFNNMEEALENFTTALNKIENVEDRNMIRVRINKIIDSLEISIQKN